MTSPLLINEPPLQVLPTLAERIGLHESIVLQQIHYWISNPKIGKEFEGKRWVRNSLEEWRDGNFKFWCISTIQHILKNLLKAGYLLKTKLLNGNKYDHTLWYSINYDALNKRIEPEKKDHIDPVTSTKTLVTPSVPTNTITDESVKVTTSDPVKVTESSTKSLSENTNTKDSSAGAEKVPPKTKPYELTFSRLALECFSLKENQINGHGGRIGAILHGRTGKNGSMGLWEIVFGDKKYTPERDKQLADELARALQWWRDTKPKLSVPTSADSLWKTIAEFRKNTLPPPNLDDNGADLNRWEPNPDIPGTYRERSTR